MVFLAASTTAVEEARRVVHNEVLVEREPDSAGDVLMRSTSSAISWTPVP
jgi:hypothetical protein